MKKILLLFLVMTASLEARTVDIVANFPVSDVPCAYKMATHAGYTFSHHHWNYIPGAADKVLVWNCVFPDSEAIFGTEREKLIFFLWEPWKLDPSYYERFSRVYTWDDTLVDGEKFFKFYYPSLMPMQRNLPEFENKKFCTLVASNWTEPRIEMIRFFETKPEEDFDFYGYRPLDSKLYRGPIPGLHSGNLKIEVMKGYRFCICFENSIQLDGYITEKIFCCFAAGCVPVYWGAPNVEKYIPKNCYVDYRDFEDKEALYLYLKTMSKETYEGYLENIRAFLKSPQAELFTPRHFDAVVYDALLSD